jgi:hypothetical protein
MKALLCFLLLSAPAFAQDPEAYLKAFDGRIYSLKTKGVRDIVVDIESSQLAKQVKDEELFGKQQEPLVFRTYWTAEPERLAIEVLGLPEGFRELKENLKGQILQVIDNLLPVPTAQRFAGYKFILVKPRELRAVDASGLAPVPSFRLKFDEQDKLVEVTGDRPVGTVVTKPVYDKPSFADGKLALEEQTTVTTENGGTLTVTKDLSYGKVEGIGVLEEVEITTEQAPGGKARSVKATDTVTFKNYKLNTGAAMKYFLGEAKAQQPTAPAPAEKKAPAP